MRVGVVADGRGVTTAHPLAKLELMMADEGMPTEARVFKVTLYVF